LIVTECVCVCEGRGWGWGWGVKLYTAAVKVMRFNAGANTVIPSDAKGKGG
jgi:hypothetical protein